MSKIFTCTMTNKMTFDMRADSLEQAQEWCQLHDFEDVMHETTCYDCDYDEYVEETDSSEFIGIDISESI